MVDICSEDKEIICILVELKRKSTSACQLTKMMTMMESTTTIDLTETAAPQATSIEEIHIETIEERLHFVFITIALSLIKAFHAVG